MPTGADVTLADDLPYNGLLGQVIAANRLAADSFAERIVAESLVH